MAGADATVLHVELAGAVRATCGDRTLHDRDLGGRRPRLLLSALVRHPDRALTRDELAALLWDDQLPRTWATALRVAASKVRAALAGILGDGGHDPVVASRAGYALSLPDDVALVVDVDVALARVAEATSLLEARRATAAIDAVRDARRVLERPLLGDETGGWVERQRAELRQALAGGLELQAEAHLALDQAALAAAASADALDLEPYRETAHRLLIRSHVHAGNEGEALRAYERCRRRLAEELGAMPSPETEALFRRLLGEEPPAPAPSVPLPGRLRLVGRRRPLAALDQLLTGVGSGHGAVALVSGEAGIGKTRLARELAERAAAAGTRVLWGTCREPEWTLPFGAVIDLLPGLAQLAPPELVERLQERLVTGSGATPDADRLRVREDLRRALLAAAQVDPVLLVIDDVHWADDGTLHALRHLAPSATSASLLIALTARDAELDADSVVTRTIAALTRDPGVVRVGLEPLDRSDVDELVRSVRPDADGWADRISAQTGGVPFFVEALLLHLLEANGDPDGGLAPSAVRDVVLRRVSLLSRPCQELLRVAALVEGGFPLVAVARAAGLEDDEALDAADEAVAARLVEPGPPGSDTYQFRHAIARASIAEAIGAGRRVRLHRRLAEALEALTGPVPSPADAAELAGQYHRSASLPGSDRGVDHALRAADAAEATGGADRAATFLAMALDLLPHDDPRRTAVTARRGLALLTATRYEEGAAIVVAAADAMSDSGDRTAAAALLADGAWSAELAGSTEVAFSLATTGIGLVDAALEDDVWARLYLLDLRRQEASDPRGLGVPIMTAERRRAARLLHADPRFRGDMAWAVWDHRDEVLAHGADDVWALTMWAGRYADALSMWQRQATAAEARGQLAEAVNAWAGAASCSVALGHLAEAERMTDRARGLARRIELRGSFGLALLGARDLLVYARASESDDLLEWAAELTVHRTDRAQRWAEAAVFAATARRLAIEGRHDDARAMLDAVAEVLPLAPTAVVVTNRLVADSVAAAWLSGDERYLRVLADAVRRVLVEPDFRCPMTDPRHAQARLLGLGGSVDGAREWFDRARQVARDDGLRPLEVLIDHDEALLLLRAGRPNDAGPYLDAASKRAARLGMVGWVRRTERLALGSVG